jgi:hypothetical protein
MFLYRYPEFGPVLTIAISAQRVCLFESDMDTISFPSSGKRWHTKELKLALGRYAGLLKLGFEAEW